MCLMSILNTSIFVIYLLTVPVSHIAWHDNLVPFAIAFSSGAITIGKIQTITEPEVLTICQVNKFLILKIINIC